MSMNLDLSEEQIMLREGLRKLLADECPTKVVRQMEDDPLGYPLGLWNSLTEMGISGLTVAEAHGGMGLGTLDAAVVFEEFGRALCPTPHFASSIVSAGFIERAGSAAQKREWLPRIAIGEAIVTPAWLEPGNGFSSDGVQMAAGESAKGYRLNGTKFCVPFARAAHALLVLARNTSGGIDAVLVDTLTPGVELTQLKTLGGDAQYEVVFRDVAVPSSARVGAAGKGWEHWEAVMQNGMIALAAWSVGCADRAHELSVTYAKERVQFDRPIGGFQAIAHPLATCATEIAGARTLVYEAAWARDAAQPEATRLAAMAKQYADEAARNATTVGHQTFGGIGFTKDIDMQLFYRRAKQAQLSWCDPSWLSELVTADIL